MGTSLSHVVATALFPCRHVEVAFDFHMCPGLVFRQGREQDLTCIVAARGESDIPGFGQEANMKNWRRDSLDPNLPEFE